MAPELWIVLVEHSKAAIYWTGAGQLAVRSRDATAMANRSLQEQGAPAVPEGEAVVGDVPRSVLKEAMKLIEFIQAQAREELELEPVEDADGRPTRIMRLSPRMRELALGA